MIGLYDAKPFTTYWYYPEADYFSCSKCESKQSHYLMRYRVFLGLRFPIIPTGTTYYYVCSNCTAHHRIDGEGAQAKIICSLPSRKPIKYNKYSELDLDVDDGHDLSVFGTDKDLSKNIMLHVEDMKKKMG